MKENDPKKLIWISNSLLYGGIIATIYLSMKSGSPFVTVAIGVILTLIALFVCGLFFDLEQENIIKKIPPQNHSEALNPAMSESSLQNKFSDFPTFSPDDIEHDESIPDDRLVDDTLVCDSTGHGVDLEDNLFADGLQVAFELLETPEKDWVMTPWGYEMLFAIEATLAVEGHPSQSRELGRLRTWSKLCGEYHYKITSSMAANFIKRIDSYMSEIRKNPEARDVLPEAIEELEISAEKMKARIMETLNHSPFKKTSKSSQ
ncbi:MAG: hypothetical protein ACI9E1_002294 [Cryomorphaceae bacterium]|jgi:hypothetical protein